MKVKELTVEQFKDLVQEAIEEKLEEIIGDPDLGLELKEEVKERLRSSLAARQRGEKGIPMDEVARRAGLNW
jgi:signal recognition particle GTPase